MENNVITDYIVMQDKAAQDHLWAVYEIFEEVLGENTTKSFSYQMPTYKAKRNVIHFAAFTKHIGIYPGAKTIDVFKDKFGEYAFSKGTLQIKFNQTLPKELIKEMALFSYELAKK